MGKREPEKEEKTRSTIQTKKKNKRKTVILKMLSILKVASFFLLASQGVTCSEGADEGPIIGIDLGTTYSCVAVMEGGKVTVIANDQGNRITPSYIAFTESGERLIGDAAKNQLTSNPKNTIFDANETFSRLCEGNVGRGDPVALVVRYHRDLSPLHHGHTGVGGPEINSYDGSFIGTF